LLDQFGGFLAIAFCVAFFGTYAYALFTGRRRLLAAAGWVQQLMEPLGGSFGVRWTASSAFHITATDQNAPFARMVVTVLLKPRDLMGLTIINRLLRRNDLLLIRCELRNQPIWGVEVYRPRTLLSGLAQKEIRDAQWQERPSLETDHRVAHGGGKAEDLCTALLEGLGTRRQQLWRLAVRRQFPHLLLAVDLPEMTPETVLEYRTLIEHLVETLEPYSTRVEVVETPVVTLESSAE
jgi:hypothetical protein